MTSSELTRTPVLFNVNVQCTPCLDSGKCWVCLGTGSTTGLQPDCTACQGSGVCPHCPSAPDRA
jgi:hypothetical protein